MAGFTDVTGETIQEAEFDPMVKKYTTGVVIFFMIISVVGIPLIPFGLLFCRWYAPESLRRMSAPLDHQRYPDKQRGFLPKRGHHSFEPCDGRAPA